MTDDKIKEMVLAVIEQYDYDGYKELISGAWHEELKQYIKIAKVYING